MEILDWLNQHAMIFLLSGTATVVAVILLTMLLRRAWGHWKWQ